MLVLRDCASNVDYACIRDTRVLSLCNRVCVCVCVCTYMRARVYQSMMLANLQPCIY